jgi:uncharacterized membrane protein YdjX (TVP38/TMEM64 family)
MTKTIQNEQEATPPIGKSTRGRLFRLLFLLLVLGAVFLALRHFLGPQITAGVVWFTHWVETLGVWAPIAFIVGYILFTVALIPGAILTMASGILFGLAKGTLYATVGAVVGATCAFLISRFLARKRFEKRISSNEKFAAIDRAIAEQGGKIVLLLRLSPIFPFTYLNYALGLSRVRLFDFVWASVGMLPGTFLYVYYGKTLGDLAAIAAGSSPERGPVHSISIAFGLLATIAVTAYITRLARGALQEATDG